MLGNEFAWTKNHGGSVYDVMLTVSYDVVPVNADYYQTVPHELIGKYLLVPTRGTTVAMLAMNHFLNIQKGVHIIGSQQSGKTSMMYMLRNRINLSSHACCE